MAEGDAMSVKNWLLGSAAAALLGSGACSSDKREFSDRVGGGGAQEDGGQAPSNRAGANEPLGGNARGGASAAGEGGAQPDSPTGGAGSPGTDLGCAPGTYDCNEDASDGCEATSAPDLEVPTILAPLRGTYTGSLHARSAGTLKPEVSYSTQKETCGSPRYEVQFDDSCAAGALADCAFTNVEDDGASTSGSYRPRADLPVSATAPVGAMYAWRVRLCDASQRCSDWSAPAHLQVGRVLEDVNGDGYADIVGSSSQGTEVYFGGANFNGQPDARLPKVTNPRFVGDVNGDGFADLAGMIDGYAPCTGTGTVVNVIYGAAELTTPTTQTLCRTAGSPSVITSVAEVGDMNGDGFDDLGVAWGFGTTENSLLVFAGGEEVAGEPLVEAEAQTKDVSYAFTVSSAQVVSGRGNYDGDSYADVVAAAWGMSSAAAAARLYVLKGGTSLASSFAETIVDQPCFSVSWLENAGDVNEDGLSDWALVCSGVNADSRRFGILLGGTASAGALTNTWTTPLDLRSTTPFLDFNGDGQREFLLGLSDDTAVIWQPGSSDGEAPEHYSRYTAASFVDTADHNGDGRPDVVFGLSSGGAFRAGSSTSFNVVPTTLARPKDATGSVTLGF